MECIGEETGRSPGGVRSKARRLGLYRRERRNIVRSPASGNSAPTIATATAVDEAFAAGSVAAIGMSVSVVADTPDSATATVAQIDPAKDGCNPASEVDQDVSVHLNTHSPHAQAESSQWRQTGKAAHRVERRPRSRTGAPLVCLAMPQGYRQGSEAVRGSRAFPRDSHGSSAARPEKDRAGLRRWPSLRQEPRRFRVSSVGVNRARCSFSARETVRTHRRRSCRREDTRNYVAVLGRRVSIYDVTLSDGARTQCHGKHEERCFNRAWSRASRYRTAAPVCIQAAVARFARRDTSGQPAP